jgi:hypothetical protein
LSGNHHALEQELAEARAMIGELRAATAKCGKRKPVRDPFDDSFFFACMFKQGFRYCRNCTSYDLGACAHNRWAPDDANCWESTTFPTPHPLAGDSRD